MEATQQDKAGSIYDAIIDYLEGLNDTIEVYKKILNPTKLFSHFLSDTDPDQRLETYLEHTENIKKAYLQRIGNENEEDFNKRDLIHAAFEELNHIQKSKNRRITPENSIIYDGNFIEFNNPNDPTALLHNKDNQNFIYAELKISRDLIYRGRLKLKPDSELVSDGFGIYIQNGETVYRGYSKDGKYHGKGTKYYFTGTYSGYFDQGQRQGEGMQFEPDINGNISWTLGNWNKDELVTIIKEKTITAEESQKLISENHHPNRTPSPQPLLGSVIRGLGSSSMDIDKTKEDSRRQ